MRISQARLQMYFLGPFRIEHAGKPVRLLTRKIESLCAYLVLHPEAHAREKLAALWWGDVSDEQARGSLRKALTHLRGALGQEIVVADRQTVQWNPDAALWCDARELERVFSTRAWTTLDALNETHAQLDTLYRGELLADFYDEWIFPLRENYRAQYIETLLALAQSYRAQSEYERAMETAQRVLPIEPANERAHQQLMFCFVASGNRVAALKQYDECVSALRDELGVEPSRETNALRQWIENGASARTTNEARLTNLPIPYSSFIGRRNDTFAVKQFFANGARVVTLTGPGGSGKTRLAIQTAVDLMGNVAANAPYGDGVWWVELAALRDATHVTAQVAKTLGVRETAQESLRETLLNFLQNKNLLLILDNCEHVLESSAQLAHELLTHCARVIILATSREALRIAGEHVYPVPALAVPRRDATSYADLLREYDGVLLFVERARAIQPSFHLTEQNASAVAQICARLDGIPLALELAASRVKLLSPHEIAARLDARFDLLKDANRAAPPRHQTLRAVLDWSCDLLSEQERAMFQRMSVFAGGCTVDAVEAQMTDANANSVFDTLARLVEKSLVVTTERDGATRYTMLETIREYAREMLRASGEDEHARAKHLDYFYEMAQQAELFGPEKQRWLDRLEQELDNIRAALTFALEHAPNADVTRAEEGLRLLVRLPDFYSHRGYVVEARAWLDKFLALPYAPSPVLARGLQKAGYLARVNGDFEKAVSLLHRALKMARALGDTSRAAMALVDLGIAARDMGELAQVIPFFQESLQLFQQLGENEGIINIHYLLAETYMQHGDLETAKPLLERGLELARAEQDKQHTAWGLEGMASIAFLEGRLTEASALHKAGLEYKMEVMDKLGICYSFEGLAQVSAAEQELERAAMLWGAAAELRERMKIPVDPFRQFLYISMIPQTRERLGDAAFERAWARGQNLTLERAFAFALNTS